MRKSKYAAFIAAALAAVTAVSAGMSVHAEETPAAEQTEQSVVVSTIGSVSKSYAAAAVMQLVDAGKVELDAPVTDYLPDFRLADARYKDITVRMLLDHSSGIMGTTGGDFMILDDRDSAPLDTLLAQLRTQRLKADPGDYGAYCNDGFTLLELLVEEVSGMSFTDYVQAHIAKPLGLRHTGTPWDMFRNAGQVETYIGGVRYAPDYCMVTSSGGIIASAEDVCTFGSAFFKGDNRLLSEKAKAEMAKTSVTDPYEDGFGLGFDSVDAEEYQAAGVKVISKGGDVLEQHAHLMIAPEQKISVAVLSSGGSSMYDAMMAEMLMDVALDAQGIRVEHPAAPAEKETLDTVPEKYLAYAGVYIDAQSAYTVTFPDSRYMEITQISGNRRETQQYLYTAEDSFVKMDGRLESGRAVQAKDQTVLHFSQRNGIDYILSDSYFELGSRCSTFSHSYSMMRAPENPVSADAQAAWDARSGRKYYFFDGRYSNAYFTEKPSLEFRTSAELPGYVGSCRIVDDKHAEGALVMPGGRDIADYEIREENGAEIAAISNQAVSYISEDAIPPLDSSLTEVAVHTKKAVWYSIGESDSQTITLDIPEHAAVYVYDSYDRMTYSSYMKDYGNSVPLPAGGKIVFLGEDGGVIGITQ